MLQAGRGRLNALACIALVIGLLGLLSWLERLNPRT